jgi:hypothetical protein
MAGGAVPQGKRRPLSGMNARRPKPSARCGVGNFTVKKNVALLFAAGALMLTGACTPHPGQAAARWESQVATNLTEANQMVDKGWTVAGFTQYTDATGQPQTDYMMKKPKP